MLTDWLTHCEYIQRNLHKCTSTAMTENAFRAGPVLAHPTQPYWSSFCKGVRKIFHFRSLRYCEYCTVQSLQWRREWDYETENCEGEIERDEAHHTGLVGGPRRVAMTTGAMLRILFLFFTLFCGSCCLHYWLRTQEEEALHQHHKPHGKKLEYDLTWKSRLGLGLGLGLGWIDLLIALSFFSIPSLEKTLELVICHPW